MQLRHEGGMGSAGDTLLKHLQHCLKIEAKQRGGVEPQARKDFAFVDAVTVDRLAIVLGATQNEPVDGFVETRQTMYSRTLLRR